MLLEKEQKSLCEIEYDKFDRQDTKNVIHVCKRPHKRKSKLSKMQVLVIQSPIKKCYIKGGVGKFEKPA